MYRGVSNIELPVEVLKGSGTIFQEYRDLMEEVSVLWVGKRNGPNFCIEEVWLPTQETSSISFHIPPEETHQISRKLYDRGLELIAQLHTHPGEAFHSEEDDKGSMLLFEGQFSIVIPNFGDIDLMDLSSWMVYRQTRSNWVALGDNEVKKIFQIK